MPMDKLTTIPNSIVSTLDYEALARDYLDANAWAYLIGGAADEITVHENCKAFKRLMLCTRVLRDLNGGNTHLELFGKSYPFPILLGPIAYQKLFHPNGELETALAASAQQTGMVISTQSSVSIEEIAQNSQSPLWFQLYVQPDRGFTADLIQRAENAGYHALVVTVDAPVNGLRNREQRAGFSLPPHIKAVNLQNSPPITTTPQVSQAGLLLGGPLLQVAPTWNDIGWLRSQTRLPLLLKGIMTAEDAQTALSEGVDGLVVSNHGGRVLDTQPATIDVLPEIAASVQNRVPILLDSGIRRGTDILKALACGASAVLIGRPYVYGLAAAGAIGISHIIQILRAELEVAMALTGCRDLNAIDRSVLFGR